MKYKYEDFNDYTLEESLEILREESKNRDEQQQAEILRLQNENKSLKIYEEGYNKIAGMFVGKGMPEPAVDPEQKLIEETVDYITTKIVKRNFL